MNAPYIYFPQQIALMSPGVHALVQQISVRSFVFGPYADQNHGEAGGPAKIVIRESTTAIVKHASTLFLYHLRQKATRIFPKRQMQ